MSKNREALAPLAIPASILASAEEAGISLTQFLDLVESVLPLGGGSLLKTWAAIGAAIAALTPEPDAAAEFICGNRPLSSK